MRFDTSALAHSRASPSEGPDAPRFADVAGFIASTPRQERWRGGLPRKHRSTIFPDHVAALANQRADVLITHEAPSCHSHGFAAIDELARSLGVQLAVHGHHHRDIAYPHDPQLGFRAISVGLAGITALDGEIVHPGLYETDDIDLSRDTSATRDVVL